MMQKDEEGKITQTWKSWLELCKIKQSAMDRRKDTDDELLDQLP